MRNRRGTRRSNCPINAALEVFGDRWSLLIIRDLMLRGRRTYKEFLESDEGIATNVLANRLKSLKSSGVISMRPDPVDRRRVIYELTTKGSDLAPILKALAVWASQYEGTSIPSALKQQRNDWPQ